MVTKSNVDFLNEKKKNIIEQIESVKTDIDLKQLLKNEIKKSKNKTKLTFRRFLIKSRLILRSLKENFRSSIDGPDENLSDKQKIALEIFNTGLNDDKNIRLFSANAEKKYIVSKDFDINSDVDTFITLENNIMTVVNHIWSYDISFPKKTVEKMNLIFNRAVNRDRSKMENTINKNVSKSMTLILHDFQKRQIENMSQKN